jgi:hypothetical protein
VSALMVLPVPSWPLLL